MPMKFFHSNIRYRKQIIQDKNIILTLKKYSRYEQYGVTFETSFQTNYSKTENSVYITKYKIHGTINFREFGAAASNSIVKWHSAMKSKQISIKQKVPGIYHESQNIMDYLDTLLTVEAKSFKAKVNIHCNRYLCGNSDKWNASYIGGEIFKTYYNIFEDGTWKC
jgi:hypothetical protein